MFGAGSSRRGLLRTLGGAAAVGTVTAMDLGAASTAKHKNDQKKPKGTHGQTVTKTFANTDPIAINSYGSAMPFPSRIVVSGFEAATITDVDLVLKGYSHTSPDDVDVMLVAPFGRNAMMMSDIGVKSVTGLTIHLDDEAEADLPSYQFLSTSGAFRPKNYNDNVGLDAFDTTYAPAPSGSVALSTFDGGDPNGEWWLFVRDDLAGTAGIVAFGWELTITAKVKGKKR